MPELPEVETVCRGLNQLTLQQTINGGEVLLKRSLAYPNTVQEFWTGIVGSAITQWQRRGKYLLAQLVPTSVVNLSGTEDSKSHQSQSWLGIHLRMTGQLLWVHREQPLQKHTRIRLFFGEQELRFVDTRTFGKMWWVPPKHSPDEIITGLQALGPEPFDEKFSGVYLQQKLKNSRRTIKAALLDQRVVAGIGNIYADEALFKSKISPTTVARDITSAQANQLHNAILEILQTAIDQGGTTFSDFLNPFGINGNYGSVAWVYGRTGEPCRVCSVAIQRLKIAGRSTHFCPQCQP